MKTKKEIYPKAKGMKRIKVALLCAITLTMLLTGCGSQSTLAHYTDGLFISEVVSSNSDSLVDAELGSPDWIEIYNASDNAINLEKYSLSESTGNRYVFPAVTIAPKSYLVVFCCLTPQNAAAAASAAAASAETSEPETTEELPQEAVSGQLCTGFKLSKDGTELTLSSASGTLHKLTVPALETDISYGHNGTDTYGYFIESTPGQPNTTTCYATLKELRSGEQIPLKISEILPKDVSDAEPYAWVELYNAGNTTVSLSDYYISENLSNLKKASLPAIKLEAGQYAIVKFADLNGEDSVPFKIGDNETTIAVSDNLGIVVDQITWDADILPGISAGRNDTGSTVYYTMPTPGAANSANCLDTADISLTEGRDEVYINELLLKNTFSIIDQFGVRSPWLELYNSSAQAVSLSNYALSDNQDSLWKWNLPDITIEPNSYLIVYLSGEDIKSGELHTNFRLGGADKALYLTNLTTQKVQTVTLPAESKDNVSYGLSSDAQWLFYPQPTPMAENTVQGFTEIASISGESEGVTINEVASVSAAKSGNEDWVELYNGSSSSISLSGCYLSDSKNNTTKWPLGDISISSGGYKVIDEYKGKDGSGELSIALSGETLYLFSPQGLLLDKLDTGVLRPGISRGIYTGGAETSVAFFSKPTPGSENSGDILNGYCAAPLFSVQGGYQSGAFSLEMKTTTEGGLIYYTTNGAEPTASASQYTGPIPVSSSMAVRAVTVADGKITSDETVATYLFEDTHSLPVICLSIASSDWSTVVNSGRSNKREREGYVEYYEADGTLGVRFPAGLRVAGAGTINYKQRSINLYLRGGYGMSSVTYPFFEGYDTTTFKSLSLRNMGGWQDKKTRLKDVFVSMAANGLNVDNAQSKFAVVYLNGEYRGLYEFKENQNEDYYASKYGIDPDKVVMIRGNVMNVETGRSDKDIKNLYALAQRNMNIDANWEKYTSLADSDYFMDYLIAETFFDCYDTYNQKYVHTTDNAMKWRPVFYDFDICLSKSSVPFGKFFKGIYTRRAQESDGTKHQTYMYLYNGFINNAEWEYKFIKRYAEVLNTAMTNDKLLALYDSLVDSIEEEIPRTSKKWGDPSSASQWKSDAKALRDKIEGRRKYVKKSLQSYFDLTDKEMAELFPNG